MSVIIQSLDQSTLKGALQAIKSLPQFFYERDFRKAEINYQTYAEGNTPNSQFLVAVEGDEVLGVVGAHPREDAHQVYFLASFAVRATARGKGIGRQLLTTLERELQTKGVRHIYAETTTSSYCDATRAFYEAMGYSLVAKVDDFWAPNDPLALYRKVLN